MNPNTAWQLILLVVLISFSAFFSACETALTSVNRIRFRHLAKDQVPNAAKVLKLLEDPNRLLGAILVGNNIVNIGASALATSLALETFGSAGVGIATGLMTLLVLIFGEITPKSWAVQHAEKFSLRIAPVVSLLIRLTHPILIFLLFITNFLIRLMGSGHPQKSVITTEELRSMIDFSHEEGILESKERTMIHNVLEFGDLPIRNVMTPRTDLIALEDTASLDELKETFRVRQFSKIPIYSGNLDHIIGIVSIKRLLFQDDLAQDFSVTRYMSDPIFTYEFMQVRDLFAEFQASPTSLAIVLDEYGGTVGMVTMEDLIEEIFGELDDSTAGSGLEFIRQAGDGYLVGGSTRIDEINPLLGLSILDVDFDTIAGFLLEQLGHIPSVGEQIVHGGYLFQIKGLRGKRITEILITPVRKS
ncbi:hypothetical protein DSECCO2_375010 [anaerobic digester metagenome]|nr:hemolysin family protein [Clostridiaceae bacterium HFYG-1003]